MYPVRTIAIAQVWTKDAANHLVDALLKFTKDSRSIGFFWRQQDDKFCVFVEFENPALPEALGRSLKPIIDSYKTFATGVKISFGLLNQSSQRDDFDEDEDDIQPPYRQAR